MKKIIVHTEYWPCDQEFIDDYCDRLTILPKDIAQDLKRIGVAELNSKDPTSDVKAKTICMIVDIDDPQSR